MMAGTTDDGRYALVSNARVEELSDRTKALSELSKGVPKYAILLSQGLEVARGTVGSGLTEDSSGSIVTGEAGLAHSRTGGQLSASNSCPDSRKSNRRHPSCPYPKL